MVALALIAASAGLTASRPKTAPAAKNLRNIGTLPAPLICSGRNPTQAICQTNSDLLSSVGVGWASVTDQIVEKCSHFREHLDPGVAVVELVVQPAKAHELRLITRLPQRGNHPVTVRDIHVPVQIAVEQEDRRLDLVRTPQRRSLDYVR